MVRHDNNGDTCRFGGARFPRAGPVARGARRTCTRCVLEVAQPVQFVAHGAGRRIVGGNPGLPRWAGVWVVQSAVVLPDCDRVFLPVARLLVGVAQVAHCVCCPFVGAGGDRHRRGGPAAACERRDTLGPWHSIVDAACGGGIGVARPHVDVFCGTRHFCSFGRKHLLGISIRNRVDGFFPGWVNGDGLLCRLFCDQPFGQAAGRQRGTGAPALG